MKPMGKMKQAIKSLITFDRNDVVATVAGVFFVVIVVVGRDDGRTVFLRRIRRGRLLGPARLASGGLALFLLGCWQTARGGGVRAQREDVVSPTGSICPELLLDDRDKERVRLKRGTHRLHVGVKIHELFAVAAENPFEHLSEAIKGIVGKKE